MVEECIRDGIEVEWSVEDEEGVQGVEIERSVKEEKWRLVEECVRDGVKVEE